jgi:uncharacterized membrane protein
MLAIVTSILIFLVIVELIRRGRLKERYALLWLFSSFLMLGLSLWRNALENISRLAGIYYPPSLLFLLAFLFLLLINLHFSVAVSELSEKNKKLTQEIALLRYEIDRDHSKKIEGN